MAVFFIVKRSLLRSCKRNYREFRARAEGGACGGGGGGGGGRALEKKKRKTE